MPKPRSILLFFGAGAGSRVTSYLGKSIPTDGPPAENYAFDAFAGFTGGVFVG